MRNTINKRTALTVTTISATESSDSTNTVEEKSESGNWPMFFNIADKPYLDILEV